MHVRHLDRLAVCRSGHRPDRRDLEPVELLDELAAQPQDDPLRALDVAEVSVRYRAVELRCLQRAERRRDRCQHQLARRRDHRFAQDDYDIWLGTVTLDQWIAWNRHGSSNVLFLDGHVRSIQKADAYLGMYPGGQVLTDTSFYP